MGRAVHQRALLKGKAVVMTPKRVEETQRQIWAHVLCSECEQRLNRNGENYVFGLIDNGSSFPLLDKIKHAAQVAADQTVTTFSGSAMGIDTDKLAYFALALLWKGSVHRWPTLGGQITRVNLRGHKEQIRKYLLGRAGFPSGVVIAAACTDKASQGLVTSPARFVGQDDNHFSILMRGIWIDVVLWKGTPKRDLRHLCCVGSDKKV
ncbi:MAG TPA: hypothetical protein VIY69_01715, partial [Candidatus Acidoferrales bacterium]